MAHLSKSSNLSTVDRRALFFTIFLTRSPLHDDKIKFKTHCRSESKTIKVEHSPTRSPFRNESSSKTKGGNARPTKESNADCRNRRIHSKDCNIRSVEFEKRRDDVIWSKETIGRVGFEEQTVIKDPNMESDEYSKATRDCSRFESGEKRDRSVMDQIDGSVGRSFQRSIGSYEYSIKDNRSGEESNQIEGNPIRSKDIRDPNVMSEQQRIVESREHCSRSPIRLDKAKDQSFTGEQRERIITNQIIESADCRDEVIVRLKEALDKGLGSGECRQCVAELKEFREEVRRSRRRERTRDVDVRYISNLKSYIDKIRSTYSCDPLECPSLRERLAKHQGQHHDYSSSHPLQMDSIGLRNQFQDQASEETPLHSRSPFRDQSRLRSTRDSSSNKNNTAQTKLTFADLGNLTINIESKYNKNQDRNKDRNKNSYKRQRSADKYSNANRFKLEDDPKHKYANKHCCKQDAESNYSTSRYDSHLNRNTNNDNINDGRSYSITQTNNYSGRNSCKSPQRYTKPSTRSCKPDDVTEYSMPRTESKHTMEHAKRCYERNPSISHRNSDKYPNRYDTKSKQNKEPISQCEAECSALVTPKRTCKTTNSYINDSSHSIPLVNTETRECLVPKRISYSYEENVKEEVREWLNNVPLYQDSNHALIDTQNITNHFINNIIELSKDNQTEVYEDVLRSHINKCLDTLNVMYPSDKCDHQPFKQNLCESLMKRLKNINDKWLCNRKCNNVNARNRCSSVPRNKSKSNHSIKCTISSDYICDTKRMKMESKSQGACKESCSLLKREMEHEISSWLDELNFIKRDEKQVVTKKDVVGILASRLAPYLKKPYNAANRIILKAKIVEILDGLPICISCSKNQRVRLIRFAEELAKRLLSIQTRLENVNSSSIKSSAEANTCDKFTKINFKNYINDDIRYCLENTAVTNLKDVENEIMDVLIRNFESLCFGNDRCVRNDIVNILQSTEELSAADILKIVDCILENVKDIIKQESTGKTLSTNPTKTLIKPCLSVYKSEHDISGPSFISSLTSTPKKQTDVVNRDISKLTSEERSYVNHLSDLIRSWMNKLPEQFNSSLDKNFKETIIVDLAGDIMDQNKSEQIALNPNIDKEKFWKYFIYRWLFKLDVFEDLNLAEPLIKDLMIRLKQIPIPDMRGSQLGSRQCMEFLQGDASTEYLKVNTRDVLKDEIFMWMNEQPSELYSTNDKSVQNKGVEDLAQKLQPLLINKEPEKEITNDIGNWLNKIVKSREKERLDKMSKELTERLLRLAQDATLTANLSTTLTTNVPLTEETMKRFSFELGYAKEISEWLKNLSCIESANPNIKAKMISDLSERISERDQKKSANLNDTHADTNLVNYITKWIMKLPFDNIKELDIPIAIQQLMNRINNVNDEKKRRNGGQSQISQLQCIIECRRSSSKSKKRKCCRKSECMKQKCNDHKGLIVEIIENWSNDLPIEGKEEAVETVKSNIATKLFQKVGELNDNPIIYNDDHSFRYVLSDEVDLQLHNIPRELKLIGDKDDLKYELLEDVMLAKNVIKEIDAGEIYEQKLESTIETSMPNPIQKPHHDDPEFQIYKHRLAEKFILDNLDHEEETVKLKYTKRIQNDIDKYYQSSQNRNAVVLTKEQLYNELYSTLFKVPIPSENAIRDEVEEVKTRAEVDLWFDELPLREPNGVAELLEWDQILKTLAKRIHEIETNESNSDNKIHNEIVKWLGKLPIQSDQERNIGNFAEVLLNRLKSTTEDRKCVTASENPIVIADDNKNTCTRNKCKCQTKKCLCKADSGVSNTGRKKWVTLTSSPQHQEQFIQKRPADIILETVESWCNKLPLHANTCQEEETNRAIRDDLVTKITVKISELNSHPEVFNNDILYDDLLDNEIENWFYNLPQSAALQASKDTMKYHLKEAMKSIKPLIREGSSRHEYKQELRDTLTKTLEEPKATTADEAALINNAKEEIVDNFVEYVYNLGDDEAQLLPKGKIHEATLKYLLVVEDKNDSDSSVDPMMKGNQLISEMSKVPEPSEVVLKEEVQEIRMKNEVDDFFNEIGFLKDFPVEQELRNETRRSLAKKLTDIEDTGHTFENEQKMKGEITKYLRRLDREASPEQIDDFINELKQNESTRKAPSPKTRLSNDGRQAYSPLHQIDEFDTPNNTPNVQRRYSGPVGVPNEDIGTTYNQSVSAGVNPEGVQWQTIISPSGQVFLQPIVTPLSSRSSSPLRQYPETVNSSFRPFIGQPPDNNAFHTINSTGSLPQESRYCGPECRSNRREDMFNPMTLQTSLDQSTVDYSGLGQRVTPLTQSPHENSRPPYAPSQRYSDINSGQAAIPTTGQYYHNSGGYVEPWNTTSLGSVGQPTQQAVALIHQPLSGNYNTVENHRRMSGLPPNATARRSMAEIQQNYQMPPSTEFGYTPEQRHITLDSRNFNVPGPSYLVPQSNQNSRLGMNENWRPVTQPDGLNVTRISVRPSLQPSTPIFTHPSNPTLPHSSAQPSNSYPIMTSSHPTMQQNFNRSTTNAEIPQILVQSPTRIGLNQTVPSVRSSPDFINARTRVSASTAEVQSSPEYEGHKLAAPQEMDDERDGAVDYHCACHRPRRRWPYCAIPMLQYCDSVDDFLPVCVEYPCRYN